MAELGMTVSGADGPHFRTDVTALLRKNVLTARICGDTIFLKRLYFFS